MATLTPRTGRPVESYEDNYWSKVQWPSEPDGCWQWGGTIDPFGYGEFAVHNKVIRRKARAHRWSMDFSGQNVNPGDNIHHVCENKLCVNPDHLEVLSRADHTRVHNGETCKRGHSRAANHWIRSDGQVGHCKECQQIRNRERKVGG